MDIRQGNPTKFLFLCFSSFFIFNCTLAQTDTVRSIDSLTGLIKEYNAESNFPKAIETSLKRLKLLEAKGDKLELVEFYNQLGHVYLLNNEILKGIYQFEKALQLCEKEGNKINSANQLLSIGNAYNKMQKYAYAEKYYERVNEVAIATKDNSILMRLNLGLGTMSQKKKNYPLAINYYLKVVEISETIVDTSKRKPAISALTKIGGIYKELGKYKEAESFYKRALNAALKSDAKRNVLELYKELSDLYISRDDYRKAHEHYLLYVALNDSLFKSTSKKETEELLMKYNRERQEREAENLQAERGIKQLKAVNDQYLCYGGVALLILAAATSMLIYKLRQLKK